MPAAIHVSKRSNAHNAVCSLDIAPTGPLPESSVRIRTTLISMTTNNPSYAPNGSPLPCPGLSSTGYGRWSSHPVDLRLETTESAGDWLKRSPRRAQLMTLYNRYEQMDGGSSSDGCPPVGGGRRPVLGGRRQLIRLEQDGACLLVEPSAEPRRRVPGSAGPAPAAIGPRFAAPVSRHQNFRTKSARYDESDAMAWSSGFRPTRVIIVYFRAPKAVRDAVSSAASGMSPAVAVTYAAVGAEAKIYSDTELATLRERAASPGR
ncbi:hypothetical protein DL768_007486 [Monosporascus sp. mg162]|nr:hypothetical protein DL768_007486 [Monosporascus sp. mg162]